MQITILNIANKAPSWVAAATLEYLKRINHGKYTCALIELKAGNNLHKNPDEIKEEEAKKFLAHIPKNSFIIALDERGKSLNSIEFARNVSEITNFHKHITFIIGGNHGIHKSLLEKSHYTLSLSKLVFPHMLVRIILLEQIYRAISILENHPYHRE